MDSELFYNTPTFPKDTEYTECENCDGTGFIYCYGEDGELYKEDCPECENGQLPIE